jgi:outer membrane protein assembly factor BamA
VNPVPELDREKRIAGFTFFVDPGKRVYVRRVNVTGNQKTQDEVVRRELRQLESSWYSLEKIARSKERLQRTGFFSDVAIETPAIPGTSDQVDVNVNVTERNTGTLNFGVGYSAAEKLTVSASISQSNFLGTGNLMALQVNNGSVNKVYSFSYLNPYWTADGVSRGFDFFRRDVDTRRFGRGIPHLLDRRGRALRHPGDGVRHREPRLHRRTHQAADRHHLAAALPAVRAPLRRGERHLPHQHLVREGHARLPHVAHQGMAERVRHRDRDPARRPHLLPRHLPEPDFLHAGALGRGSRSW